MHPDRSAASDQGRDRRGRTDAKPRVPGRANPTKTGGGKLVDLQAYAKRCDDRVEPSGKRSQPEAEQVPPVQDDRVQGPAGIRAASGPIPDTSFPRARGATWIAGAADDVEWDAPRAGIHPVRRSPRSAMKTVFIGVLGCRCTPIRAETTPLEQVRLAVRLAVHAEPRENKRRLTNREAGRDRTGLPPKSAGDMG